MSKRQGGLKKIPETSYDRYVSGWYALNIPKSDGSVADWHPLLYWLSTSEKEETVPLTSASPILGRRGIEYREITYPYKAKVHIATFPRALADLILWGDEQTLQTLRGCGDDYLSEEEEEEFYHYLKLINEHKDIGEFILYQCTKQLWRDQNGTP